jgi:hypothetical protein
MKPPRTTLKTLAHAVFCITPLLLPLANGQVLVDDAPDIPSSKFTPPPPPKEVPPKVIRASTITPSQDRNITLIRGEASTLADIPPPPVSKPSVPGRESEPHNIVSIGASVYDHSLSHVKWTNPETKESFEAWCGWDFTLLSPISQIEISEKFSLFHLAASNIDTDAERRFGRKTVIPAHPEVIADGFAISKGDAQDPTAQHLLTTLRDYYLKHKPRLILIKKAQAEYQAAAAAWHKANPPKPENHTFWLKPHRGSRYLTQEGGR